MDGGAGALGRGQGRSHVRRISRALARSAKADSTVPTLSANPCATRLRMLLPSLSRNVSRKRSQSGSKSLSTNRGMRLPRPGNWPTASPTAARYNGSFSSRSRARAAASTLGTTRCMHASYSPIHCNCSAVAWFLNDLRPIPGATVLHRRFIHSGPAQPRVLDHILGRRPCCRASGTRRRAEGHDAR